MSMRIARLRRSAVIGTFGLLLGLGAAAAGEDASRWDGDARSAVRLIAGTRQPGAAVVRAGIEIKLKGGWHTYWRYPGDAGVPPRFDFAASKNVKAVEVLWPAPQRIPEQGLVVIGYTSSVILPLRITPHDPAKPVILRLKLDYAVCEKLCVPADAKAELVLKEAASSHDAALAAAEARVPKKVALGQQPDGAQLAIRSVNRDDAASPPRVIVDVAGPPGTDLLAEGPTPDWALPLPAPLPGAPAGVQRFAFAREGAPPGSKFQDVELRLTAVAGVEAIEVVTRLD